MNVAGNFSNLLTLSQRVAGSSPASPTDLIKCICGFWRTLIFRVVRLRTSVSLQLGIAERFARRLFDRPLRRRRRFNLRLKSGSESAGLFFRNYEVQPTKARIANVKECVAMSVGLGDPL